MLTPGFIKEGYLPLKEIRKLAFLLNDETIVIICKSLGPRLRRSQLRLTKIKGNRVATILKVA